MGTNEEKELNQEIEKLTTEQSYKNQKENFLLEMKINRSSDFAIRSRAVFKDINATKAERLTKTFYEKLKKETFQRRERHQRLTPVAKADFPYLANYDVKLCTLSHHTPGLDRESREIVDMERSVILKVSFNEFSESLKGNLKILFPDCVNERKNEFFVASKELDHKIKNTKRAMSLLSKMIHEATMLDKVGNPESWEEYSKKLDELKNGRETETDFDENKTPKILIKRFEAERKKAAKDSEKKIKNLSKEMVKAFVCLQGKEETVKNLEKWSILVGGGEFGHFDKILVDQMKKDFSGFSFV